MTAIHVFDLSDPDDVADYTNAVHATAAIVALDEVREMLRGLWKHADLSGETADKLIDDIWREFHDIAGAVLEATE
jgi:hypothetical protein